MKNREIDRIKKERAIEDNATHWYKRIGSCNPNICGGACCRYACLSIKEKEEYHDIIFLRAQNVHSFKKVNKKVIRVEHVNCPHLKINGRCSLHGKKVQSYTCDVFPMHKSDGVYCVVKDYCSYRFVRVKNDKYKRRRKKTRSKRM